MRTDPSETQTRVEESGKVEQGAALDGDSAALHPRQ